MNQWDGRGWPPAAEKTGTVQLRLDATADDADCISNISATAILGDSLFLASDEGGCIERLTWDGSRWSHQLRVDLTELLDVRDKAEEMDLEGLAACDGWLWVLGSHARTRPKVKRAEGDCIDLDLLANLKDTRARALLARLPLVRDGGGWMPVGKDGIRRAGIMKQDKNGNAIARLLRNNTLIQPFTCLPAKEGGVDLEGIAVCGERVALGMRGPVIGGHALLVEVQVAAKKSGKLHLVDDEAAFRLLALEGLGIRDLHRDGDDLLILAGPTTSLSGPCAVYRWTDWANDPPQDLAKVRLHRPERVLELPFGRGVDHPEGIAIWDRGDGGSTCLLVACDSPAPERLLDEGKTIVADLFALPGGAQA